VHDGLNDVQLDAHFIYGVIMPGELHDRHDEDDELL
jgi:hypothetical protein